MDTKFSELAYSVEEINVNKLGELFFFSRIWCLFTFYLTELEACDKPAKFIIEELRKTINRLADDQKRVVMVYFMGYTKMVCFSLLGQSRNSATHSTQPPAPHSPDLSAWQSKCVQEIRFVSYLNENSMFDSVSFRFLYPQEQIKRYKLKISSRNLRASARPM